MIPLPHPPPSDLEMEAFLQAFNQRLQQNEIELDDAEREALIKAFYQEFESAQAVDKINTR